MGGEADYERRTLAGWLLFHIFLIAMESSAVDGHSQLLRVQTLKMLIFSRMKPWRQIEARNIFD